MRTFGYMAASKGNKYALGNDGGRPSTFETPEKLLSQVISYFDYCNESNEKATITGLTLYLGFSSRSSLDDYSSRSEEFSYIIKRSKLAVENSYELSGQTIDIFALKNMGWTDKQEVISRNVNYNSELTRDEIKKISETLDSDV
jgi:hypothetical protein